MCSEIFWICTKSFHNIAIPWTAFAELTVKNCILDYNNGKQQIYVITNEKSFSYTVLRFCSTPTFPIFNLSGFEREPLKLGKQMIPHFVALDVGFKMCQVQQYSSIRGCHTTFLLKSTLFKGEVAWQPLTERQGYSLFILEQHIRAFKWGTVCFSAIIPFEDISGYVQKSWFYLVKMYIFGYYR